MPGEWQRPSDKGAEAVVVVGDLDVPDPGVRPRCRGRATAFTWPSVIGRRKVALFAWLMAAILSPRTSPARWRVSRCFRQRRVDPPVHEAEGLTDIGGHLDPGADLVGHDLLVLDADQLPQPVASERPPSSGLEGLTGTTGNSSSSSRPPLTMDQPEMRSNRGVFAQVGILSRRGPRLRTLSEWPSAD